MSNGTRPLAVVTGASTGIGRELAERCAEAGFDLVVAADEPAINDAAAEPRGLGAAADAVEPTFPRWRARTSSMRLWAGAR